MVPPSPTDGDGAGGAARRNSFRRIAMSFRVTGALLTSALLAVSAFSVEAAPVVSAPANPAPTTVATRTGHAAPTPTRRSRRRAYRHRVPPEGGVYARNAIL